MRTAIYSLLSAAVLFAAPQAMADAGKDESGKGRWYSEYRDDRRHYREYKEEFRSGNCKVERKWERDGGYKEEIKCKGRRRD